MVSRSYWSANRIFDRLVGTGLPEQGTNLNNSRVQLRIGETLKDLLKAQRLSPRGLSKLSGVPYTTLQEWSGNRSPKNPLQIQQVASTLGVSMHFLLFGAPDPEENITNIFKEDVFSGTFEITIKKVRTK